MEQWFMANLGDAMLAGDELDRVCALFGQLGDRNATTAVLMRHENHGGLHCELMLYFPPELADLAACVGATPCGRPDSSGLGVAVGSRQRIADLRAGE